MSTKSLLAAVVVVGSLVVGAGCTKSPTPPERTANGAPAPVSTAPDLAAAKKALEAGAVLVDVRTPGEFAEEHAEKSVNVPVDQISSKAETLWPKKTKLVVVCASGHRAGRAVEELRARGYTDVVNGGAVDSFMAP
jgi:rhodanese-related sulfurtransferase